MEGPRFSLHFLQLVGMSVLTGTTSIPLTLVFQEKRFT